ncbi:MAG: hypothetical protein EGS78_00140 [Bacteroidales bacterium]|nr:hypothetical protein [Bacteroidales bacterium]
MKSYSKKRASYAKSFAVCLAIVTLASCGEKTGNSMFHTVKNAADAYRSYLSEVRKEANLPTDRLIEKINDWQSLRDSVSACVAKDTVNRIHANYESEIRRLHDSLRVEFTRLALEKPRTFADVLLIREQTSQYRQDTELMRSVAEAEPFFKPLDSVQTYKGSADAVVEKYRMFLSKTLKSGISGKSEMLAFIKEEDRLFRSFLSHLPELADADLSVITRDTEKCCLSIFRSVENGRLSYRDALVYTARRTNRRIILNALTCRDDINQGNVKTEAQARAYVWMLLQPYVALDGFSMTVMSETERIKLYEVANNTPLMIAKLNKTAGTDNDQWQVLPRVLIKIMLTSI